MAEQETDNHEHIVVYDGNSKVVVATFNPGNGGKGIYKWLGLDGRLVQCHPKGDIGITVQDKHLPAGTYRFYKLPDEATTRVEAKLDTVIELQQTSVLAVATILDQLSPFNDDPTPSSASSTPAFKTLLVKHYGLDRGFDEQGRHLQLCQATGEVLVSGALVGGHLFPRKSVARADEWGILDPDNDARNGLLWFYGIEAVWTKNQICLHLDGQKFRLRVLDKDILDKSPVAFAAHKNRQLATPALINMTFKDLDGREIYIPDNVPGPYQRVVAAQAAYAICNMWKRDQLPDNMLPFRLDVLSSFKQKAACLAWVKTTMAYLPEWPIGPEPLQVVDDSASDTSGASSGPVDEDDSG